ncbi:hypothetical protein KC332_g8675 [Hortaea werneckii]|uniref:Gem-associated protein 5 TPR domain-containing protein n=2 Tax=Hortaea werneckii TaxID=91943 RepID=A0A3M7IAP2_HORWE|nr:hypothetical protein KC358_g8643 [Hortaea werneckii]OTA27054.1 hypothetical protein BTJ68_12089 [Hortaea werneckii EXF-2000]KAI6828663.1 hypothetical protein KC350_g8019 [Hortaea werneckii]KAI6925754.1 hypothetical protein KC348_g8898 [Hortaea werneckii]KAI6934189.1 hypothetical protein KC341_g7782 [Hortaea werneckii]
MSVGQHSRHNSSTSKPATTVRSNLPAPTLTPENTEPAFEPCAATASFLLYSQRNTILVLHHDTLAIERRFESHREDVQWIYVDNVSERGSGRLAVSYDIGNTVIVWDILTGIEVARFSSYEHLRTASFMRNGNIAFGNDQGSVILFEPGTSEHISARTIFDPVTAIAPAADCRAFAIGYLNGSILIATLRPSFTILHTLTTNKAPSRICGLSWHGSSSKQRTDMLATQTADGDLRVWSVPKVPHQDPPTIIRVLQRAELQAPGACWFGWSKNGRIVQHVEGETRTWDVRTKRVTYDMVPTMEGIIAMCNYGPTATLFTLSRNHVVQQYDITPDGRPMQVASVQHVPSTTPPTPPTTMEIQGKQDSDPQTAVSADAPVLPLSVSEAESSADEASQLSPLQKIAREMDSLDALELEVRDKVTPLSPISSRASSVSSKSSRESRRARRYLYDQPDSSRASTTTGYNGTEFSIGEPVRSGHESMSIRSISSYASKPQYRSSHLSKEVLRSPEETSSSGALYLFHFTRARLLTVAFRTPHYGNSARTPELLQREMLSTVFGWNDDVQQLIQDELSRHAPGSASAVLLSRWLGDMGADDMASMVGSQSMTSSDWMLLALSAIGKDSQKKVGEAFVQRLLEKGDVHPAVAILLGLGEHNDAIEIYVSQGFWMEAVLLTCLTCPSEWGRQSFQIRKWGESAVQQGQAELAVRCFSCTSIETSEPWFSPRAQQDVAYAEQQQRLTSEAAIDGARKSSSPPLSPPSRSGSGRLTAKNASLKLITSFGEKGAPALSTTHAGVTPIAESALSPGGGWRQRERVVRDPSTARTATPGGFSRRRRLPSRNDIERAKQEAAEIATPVTAARDFANRERDRHYIRSRANSDVESVPEPATALKPTTSNLMRPSSRQNDRLPPPSHNAFDRLSENADSSAQEPSRNGQAKKKDLEVDVIETHYVEQPSPTSSNEQLGSDYEARPSMSSTREASPPRTGNSLKARSIQDYISSVEEARTVAREGRAQSRARSRKRGESRGDESRSRRGGSRARLHTELPNADVARYIKAPKRSPASPVPMSPGEIAQAHRRKLETQNTVEPATTDDESFYKVVSPISESYRSAKPAKPGTPRTRRAKSPSQISDAARTGRGRSSSRQYGATTRSPSSPLPAAHKMEDTHDTESDGRRFRLRSRSSSRRPAEGLQARRAASRSTRARSNSRNLAPDAATFATPNSSVVSAANDSASQSSHNTASEASSKRSHGLSRKQLAAIELEERRLSLARRPSAPTIPLPGDFAPPNSSRRPKIGGRSHTELGNSPNSTQPPLSRSHTVDPDAMSRYNAKTGGDTNGPSLPAIGLPATPRAMRHPRYMGTAPDESDRVPPVPDIPGNASELSSLGGSLSGSSLSQVTGSNVSSLPSSSLPSGQATSSLQSADNPRQGQQVDHLGPLLPSTTFGQKGQDDHARSASAPPEHMNCVIHPAYKSTLPSSARRQSGGRGHIRKISPPDAFVPHEASTRPLSIDEALKKDQQIIDVPVEGTDIVVDVPPVLPELQHLVGPPVPPPPPTMFHAHQRGSSEMINIGMENHQVDNAPSRLSSAVIQTLPQTTYPSAPSQRANTASPTITMHRRGRGSMSDSIGSRFKGVTERMRSQSRGNHRAKSPPTLDSAAFKHTPYETVLPPIPQSSRRESFGIRAKSPYEQTLASADSDPQIPPPPPPPPHPPGPGLETKFQETTIPPSSLPPSRGQSRNQSSNGYRNPKEIRANMPPDALQQGVYNSAGFL